MIPRVPVWVGPHGHPNAKGTLDDPFDLLSSATQSLWHQTDITHAIFEMFPGQYEEISSVIFEISITVRRCSNCPSRPLSDQDSSIVIVLSRIPYYFKPLISTFINISDIDFRTAQRGSTENQHFAEKQETFQSIIELSKVAANLALNDVTVVGFSTSAALITSRVTSTSISLTRCKFVDNFSSLTSAVLDLRLVNSLIINSCHFLNNSWHSDDLPDDEWLRGGAISIRSFGYTKIQNSTFQNNGISSPYGDSMEGGAISVDSSNFDESHIFISDCNFVGNFLNSRPLPPPTPSTPSAISELRPRHSDRKAAADPPHGTWPNCGGALFIRTSSLIVIRNSFFQNNTANSGAALCVTALVTFPTFLELSHTSFVENKCTHVGCGLYYRVSSGSKLNISNNTYYANSLAQNLNCQVPSGGAYNLRGGVAIYINGGFHLGEWSPNGANLVNLSTVISDTVFMSNHWDDTSSCPSSGAAIMALFTSDIQIFRSNFTRHKNGGHGALIWSLNAAAFTFVGCHVSDNYYTYTQTKGLQAGSSIFIEGQISAFTQDTTNVRHWSQHQSADIPTQLQLHPSEIWLSSRSPRSKASWRYRNQTVIEKTEKVSGQYYSGWVGGTQSYVTINDCVFAGNFGTNWNLISISRADFLSFERNELSNITSGRGASSLSMRSVNSVYIAESTFTDVYAGIMASQVSIMRIVQSFFQRTFDQPSLSLIQVDALIVTECDFYQGNTGAINLYSVGETLIHKSRFEHNKSPENGAAISARLGMDQFIEISASAFSINKAMLNGGAIWTFGGGLTLNSSSFSLNEAQNGGAVYQATPTIGVENKFVSSSFIYNEAKSRGGAISIFGGVMTRLQNLLFLGNGAYRGGAFSAVGLEELTIESCNFFSNQAIVHGGAVYLQKVAALILRLCNFSYNIGQASLSHFRRQEMDQTNLRAPSLTYRNQIPTNVLNPEVELATGGGAIFVGVSMKTLQVTESTFKSNSALAGAGIYFESGKTNWIISSTQFVDNFATLSGGAIHVATTEELMPLNLPWAVSSEFGLNKDEWKYSIGNTSTASSKHVSAHIIQDPPNRFGEQYLTNVTCTRNRAQLGGALSLLPTNESGIKLSLQGSTFIENSALLGGTIFLSGPGIMVPSVYSSIFFKNLALLSGGLLFFNPTLSSTMAIQVPYLCPADSTECNVTESSAHGSWGHRHASTAYRIFASTTPYPDGYESCSIGGSSTQVHLGPGGNGKKILISPSLHQQLSICIEDLYKQRAYDNTLYELIVSSFSCSSHVPSNCSLFVLQPPTSFIADSTASMTLKLAVNASFAIKEFITYEEAIQNAMKKLGMPTGARLTPASVSLLEPHFNPFHGGTTGSVSVTTTGSRVDSSRFSISEVTIPFELKGCPKGEGLQRMGQTRTSPNSEPLDLYSCAICPQDTYNLNGDGQCYLCLNSMYCEGDLVIGRGGYWLDRTGAGEETTNLIHLLPCRSGFCSQTPPQICAPTRTGILCGDCVQGFEESYAWDQCLPEHVCSESKGKWFFTLFFFAIVLALPFVLHHTVFYYPTETTIMTLCLELSILISNSTISHFFPTNFYALTCGFNTTSPIHRMAFWTLIPFIVIVPYALVCISVIIISNVRSSNKDSHSSREERDLLIGNLDQENEDSDKNDINFIIPTIQASQTQGIVIKPESFFTLSRVTLTIFTILYMCIPPFIYLLVNLSHSIKTSAGIRWIVAPSVSVADPRFISFRNLSMALLGPSVIIVGLFVLASAASAYAGLEKRKEAVISFFLSRTFHLVRAPYAAYRYWFPVAELLVIRIGLPSLISFEVTHHPAVVTAIPCVLLVWIFVLCFASPYATRSHSLITSLGFGILSIMSLLPISLHLFPSESVGWSSIVFVCGGILLPVFLFALFWISKPTQLVAKD